MPRAELKLTPDFQRIHDLPRREISPQFADELAEELSGLFTRPGSGASFNRWQALALYELAQTGTGAVLGYPVGTGKSLIFDFAPTVVGAKRPMLILPASLEEKTYVEREKYRAAGFQFRDPLPSIVTKQSLGVESGADLLNTMQPDFIGLDEADEWSNPDSAAALRLGRYITERRAAGKPLHVMAASGTLLRNSILDVWHLLGWALDQAMPLPMVRAEAEKWALALDNKPAGMRSGSALRRPHPGPLGATREIALAWLRRRMAETLGVILLDEDSAANVPLTICHVPARECPEIDQAMRVYLETGETPTGLRADDPLSKWRKDSELGLGLCLYWDPMPPDEWREAYRAKSKFVDYIITRGTVVRGKYLDSEGQVMRAFASHEIIRAWQAIKPTFTPITKCKWISSSGIESCVDWLDQVEASKERGIIWTGVTEFAESLADATGLQLFGPNGRCTRTGATLVKADPTKHIICSWHANKKGFNLQPWTRMLITSPPSSGKWLEQVFGRSHRAYQDKPVTVDFLMTSGGTYDRFDSALDEAGFSGTLTGVSHKISRAEIVRAKAPVTATNGYRWTRGADPRI